MGRSSYATSATLLPLEIHIQEPYEAASGNWGRERWKSIFRNVQACTKYWIFLNEICRHIIFWVKIERVRKWSLFRSLPNRPWPLVVQAVGLTELLEWMEADALSLIAACLPDIYLRLPWWGWARATACPILSPLEEPACWLVWKYFEARLAVQCSESWKRLHLDSCNGEKKLCCATSCRILSKHS
jgi:hypothetical protein